MFKIVQTIEDDCAVLTTVPESWEKNGILYWPTDVRRAYKLRKNANNFPDVETWTKSRCTVKKDKIPTLKNALEDEKELSKYANTEDEENFRLSKSVNRLHPAKAVLNMDDFNYLIPFKNGAVDVVGCHNPTRLGLPNTTPPMHVDEGVVPNNEKEEETPLEGIYTIQYEDTPHHDVQEPDALEVLEGKLDKINKNQEELMKSVAGLHAKFNKLIDMMATANVTASEKEDHASDTNQILRVDELNLFPINTTDKMDEVELKLLDKDFHSLFVKKFSQIGGVEGKATFTKIIYMVLDAMFDRTFLLEVSWTGASKVKGKKKISMLQYKEIISMFFKVINLADSRYTIADNETFFKRVLKNSASRANKKGGPKTNIDIVIE